MIKIFIEGVTDIKLLKDLVFFTFNQSIAEDIFVKTGGYGGLFNEQNLNQLRINTAQDGVNLVIFDADNDFSERKDELLSKAIQYEVEIKLFLFPNNIDSGDREKLLRSIANPDKYTPFDSCFEPYELCLKLYNKQYIQATGYPLNHIPNNKIAIHNYLRLYNQETKEKRRDYMNAEYWDLTHGYLTPLRDFLRPFFI
jgi:hypothetical protein